MEGFLLWFDGVPAPLVYLGLGVGAGLENIVPAIPADTFVALGGVLSVVGRLDWRWVLASTWSFNAATALAVYRLGRAHGPAFLGGRWGQRLMSPPQIERMRRFYARYGVAAIFLTRFLPGLRAVVPVFAGVSRMRLLPVAIPIFLASGIWYGALVALGRFAGDNLHLLDRVLGQANSVLVAVAAIVGLIAATWWWRSRRFEPEDRE